MTGWRASGIRGAGVQYPVEWMALWNAAGRVLPHHSRTRRSADPGTHYRDVASRSAEGERGIRGSAIEGAIAGEIQHPEEAWRKTPIQHFGTPPKP